jgi:long-chain acyl-CoA synthetase
VEIVANLAELVSHAAERAPDDPAIADATRTLTWSELNHEVHAVASGLASMGLVAGARVLIAVGNRMEFVTSYLGSIRAGLVAVPVNPTSVSGEFNRMIADSGARCCVCERGAAEGVRTALQKVNATPRVAP